MTLSLKQSGAARNGEGVCQFRNMLLSRTDAPSFQPETILFQAPITGVFWWKKCIIEAGGVNLFSMGRGLLW